MSLDWPQEIAQVIQPYDSADLLTSVAALQLLPQNAERALRLEALANAVSTLPQVGKRTNISIAVLRRTCNGSPLADISSQEDPSEQAFTEALTFIGGSYIVFPGIVDDATFVLRHLAQAITQYEELFPKAFLDIAVQTLGAGLTLSDLVATRAGLTRGIPPDSRGSKVYIPQSSEFNRLKHAIQLKYEVLERALNARGFDLWALEPLTVALGKTSLAECTPTSGPLNARPLVQVGDSIVMAVPGLVLAALRHRLICLAKEYSVSEALAEAYRHAVWQSVRTYLDLLGHEPENVPLPPIPNTVPVVDGVFSMDTDKALYVSLTSDDFSEYDESEVFSRWECPELPEWLEERQGTVEELLFQIASGLNEVVVLHVIAGVGRAYALGFGHPLAPLESLRLAMSASDLEVIALLERRDSLMLRKYAMASTQLRKYAQVIAWSGLDEFSMYRSGEYSYYFSDDAKPNMLSISPGSGLELRLQAIREFDLHAVPAFEPGYFIEVVRIEQKYEMPIYSSIELARTQKRLALVVEGLPVCVWIIGPDFDEEPDQVNIARVYLQVVDLVAYWIWQFSPALSPSLRSFQEKSPVLVLQLRADPSENWMERPDDAEQANDPIAEYELLENGNTILLRINPSLQRDLAGPDNRGERSLMNIVLHALGEAIAEGLQEEEPPVLLDTQGILDKYAPLGRKKKMLVLDPHMNPALSTSGLSKHRGVKMADKSMLLDRVGTYLTEELRMPVGPIRREDRTEVLDKVVGVLYRMLCSLVSTLNSRVLLDWLVRYHEAIRYDMSQFRLTIPTRLACFGAGEEFVSAVTDELQELNEAAQAARSVIEYVAAQPPNGLRPMSWSVYDELQALAAEIVLWAGISDLVHYGIADLELSILRSGRLGSSFNTLVGRASKGFLSLHSLERIDYARDLFDRHWLPVESLPKRHPKEVEEIDGAFAAEFAYTLTELTTLMADCFAVGTEQKAPVKRMSVDSLIERLAQSTGCPHSKVIRMLDGLSLESRDDFLRPPVPFRKEDVYPWRFARPLSYMRRPLIRTTENGGPVFMWGNLHIYDSIDYTVDMCLSGRFQSRVASQEMRSLLARFNQEKGFAFTLRVRTVFDVHGSLVVDSNVRKIGKTRIAELGNDLGDIDVLVVSPRRRRVVIAECKDLSIARNPYEMANELQTLFVGDDKPSTVVRHQRRARWIENNLTSVLEHYGVEPVGKWRVEPILVVSEEMLTPHIYHPPMPVISFRTLRQRLLEDWV